MILQVPQLPNKLVQPDKFIGFERLISSLAVAVGGQGSGMHAARVRSDDQDETASRDVKPPQFATCDKAGLERRKT